MKDWIKRQEVEEEVEKLYEKLDKELSNKIYNISTDSFTFFTGKYGYINFECALLETMLMYNYGEK